MNKTSIQWAHSTVNPLMGCTGCELYPLPSTLLLALDQRIALCVPGWRSGDARAAFREAIGVAYDAIHSPAYGQSRALSTTNIVHAAPAVAAHLAEMHGEAAARAVVQTIDGNIVCYAAKLHLNRATSIAAPSRRANPGYAPTFESIRPYPGRSMRMARQADLLGTCDPAKPWVDGLPRLIFVGDMGDIFARRCDFDFISSDLMAAIDSAEGQRHIWLLLTKRPDRMAEFSRVHGRFPRNVCCMTTVTSTNTMDRLDQLRSVDCTMRGISAEPLWERIAPVAMNLDQIDWLIVGGASGARRDAKPFDLGWARELRDQCRNIGVAYFLKQLGSNPIEGGQPYKCADRHGGEWHDWPIDLRVREFPTAFHRYRSLAH
jgi:protein gp37